MKRRISILLIFLLAGAVVNVAVAWGCAHFRFTDIRFHRDFQGVSVNRQFDAAARKYQGSEATLNAKYIGLGRDYISATGWDPPVSMMQSLQQMNHTEIHFTVYRAGLPLRSLTGDAMISTKWVAGKSPESEPWTYAGMLTWGQSNGHYRVLLLRAVWPGFAINMLVYAVLVAVVWFAVRAGYHYLTRSRRGLCPVCAYPRGESDMCSECGRPLPQRARLMT